MRSFRLTAVLASDEDQRPIARGWRAAARRDMPCDPIQEINTRLDHVLVEH
jgi:hypothetical protein